MKLSLAEGLYLIALDDEEGRLLVSAERTIDHGLVASGVLELYISGKLSLDGDIVALVNSGGTGNKILDAILARIGDGGKITKVVNKITHEMPNVQEDVTQLLVTRGIIQKESTKLLWIPVSERMGNANYEFEQDIRDSLHKIVLKGAKPTPSWLVLMSMVHYNNLLGEVFRKKDDLIDAVKVAKDIVKNAKDTNLGKALNELSEYFSSLSH